MQVDASWLRELPGAVPLENAAPVPDSGPGIGVERRSFALNEGIAEAVRATDVQRESGTFSVFEIEHALATRVAELIDDLPEHVRGDLGIAQP